MTLKSVINVVITRQTKTVAKAGFGIPMIMGINKATTDLLALYSSMDSVLTKFRATDPEAVAAQAIFNQSPSVTQVAITRRATGDNCVITVATVENSATYTCTINGTVFSVVSDATATAIEIAGLLVAAINAGAEPVTATDNADGTYDLDPDVAGVAYTVLLDTRQTIAFTTPNAIGTDLLNIKNENDTWYGFVYTGRTLADVEDCADWVESQKKIFVTASLDANIIDQSASTDTTTIAYYLNSKAYERSAVIFLKNADTEYPDAALLGEILPRVIGSYSAAYKTLTGITTDVLTETQETNALAKEANIYTEIASNNVVREGTVGSGEYIDIMIGADWLEARMAERLFELLINNAKLPYTNEGITAVDGAIRAQLEEGIDSKLLSSDTAYTVTVPDAVDISAGDKAARILNGVTFDAPLAGAIHKMNIAGTINFGA